MKTLILSVGGFALLLASSGCSKKVAAAPPRPPDTAPVAQAQPAPLPRLPGLTQAHTPLPTNRSLSSACGESAFDAAGSRDT